MKAGPSGKFHTHKVRLWTKHRHKHEDGGEEHHHHRHTKLTCYERWTQRLIFQPLSDLGEFILGAATWVGSFTA
ncbi:unnamed protein product, partial [Amoebophrya sp. A25]|eukprot:GSA25T00008233001.1